MNTHDFLNQGNPNKRKQVFMFEDERYELTVSNPSIGARLEVCIHMTLKTLYHEFRMSLYPKMSKRDIPGFAVDIDIDTIDSNQQKKPLVSFERELVWFGNVHWQREGKTDYLYLAANAIFALVYAGESEYREDKLWSKLSKRQKKFVNSSLREDEFYSTYQELSEEFVPDREEVIDA